MTTMNDIAKALGVSRPVVSSVFSTRRQGTVRVSDKTRQRILEKAREMGYRPNHVARSVATGKTRVVAFVGGVVGIDFVMHTLSGVMSEAEKHAYTVKVMQRTDEGWSLSNTVNTLLERRVDGVIFYHMDQPSWDELMVELRGAIPTVALSCVASQGAVATVNSDNSQAYNQIIDMLMTHGHRRIAMICGMPGTINARAHEFEQTMLQRGLPLEPWMIQRGDWEVEKAEQATRDLLSRPADQRPTAICCANDEMAMGAIRTARAMGFDLPKQLSIVGYGNTNVAHLADPPLTSIDESFNTMGRLACEKLINVLEHGETAQQIPTASPSVMVPTKLIRRASTADIATF
ncbi:MAG: LacI family DNA-binding transcriptional regulator [Phycisphaeraceae bacterium JB051]